MNVIGDEGTADSYHLLTGRHATPPPQPRASYGYTSFLLDICRNTSPHLMSVSLISAPRYRLPFHVSLPI